MTAPVVTSQAAVVVPTSPLVWASRWARMASTSVSVRFGTANSTSRGAVFTFSRGTSSTFVVVVTLSSSFGRASFSPASAFSGESTTTVGASWGAPWARGRVIRTFRKSSSDFSRFLLVGSPSRAVFTASDRSAIVPTVVFPD